MLEFIRMQINRLILGPKENQMNLIKSLMAFIHYGLARLKQQRILNDPKQTAA